MLIDVKVKVARTIDGKTRKKTETYVIDKELYSEAEYKITEELVEEQNSNLLDNFEIQQLKISSIKEICPQYKGENTYVATLKDIFLDDKGVEKPIKYKVLLWANNLTEANTRTIEIASQGYNMQVEGIKQVDYIYIND